MKEPPLALLNFTIISFGTAPNPCPTVPVLPFQYKLQYLNPASVLACTDDAIEPSLLVLSVPPLAFQCHITYVLLY